jgi:hypothetical protein
MCGKHMLHAVPADATGRSPEDTQVNEKSALCPFLKKMSAA